MKLLAVVILFLLPLPVDSHIRGAVEFPSQEVGLLAAVGHATHPVSNRFVRSF